MIRRVNGAEENGKIVKTGNAVPAAASRWWQPWRSWLPGGAASVARRPQQCSPDHKQLVVAAGAIGHQWPQDRLDRGTGRAGAGIRRRSAHKFQGVG